MNGKIMLLIRQSLLVVGLMSVIFSTTTWASGDKIVGAVYAMTNATDGNEIAVFNRTKSGTLSSAGYYATLGNGGTGDPFEPVDALGAQSPLILSHDQRLLFAVNAGSDSISVFHVIGRNNSLKLINTFSSKGNFPVSLTMHHNILYVLNSGGEGSIAGFKVNHAGKLRYIAGSLRSLNAGGTNPPFFLVSPAQIQFGPHGDNLVVTVKGSNSIHVFAVDAYGKPSASPTTTISNGETPFGFSFDRRGNLLVAEAFGSGMLGEESRSAVSSYKLMENGSLRTISQSVANFQTASCWLVTTRRIPYAYTTNNASHTISGYAIGRKGTLSLLNATGVSAYTGDSPVDLTVTKSGKYLYALNAGSGTISTYKIARKDGSLTSLGEIGGLPVRNGAVGIAVR